MFLYITSNCQKDFKKKEYQNTYYIYRNSESQKYIAGKQDGIYYLTLTFRSVKVDLLNPETNVLNVTVTGVL